MRSVVATFPLVLAACTDVVHLTLDDTQAPQIVAREPAVDASGVDVLGPLRVTFSEEMQRSSLESALGILEGGVSIPGATSTTNNGATFIPFRRMALLKQHQAQVASTASDVSGNALASPVSWTFSTRDGVWGATGFMETSTFDASRAGAAVAGTAAVVAWWQADATRNNLVASFWNGSNWEPPDFVETIDDSLGKFDITLGPDGTAFAVFLMPDAGAMSIWASRYTPSTGWEPAEPIENLATQSYDDPEVAVDSAGFATAVWAHHNGTDRYDLYFNRYEPGVGWGTATLLESDDTGSAYYPQLAVLDDDSVTVLYWHQEGAGNGIWSRRFDGTWSTPQLLDGASVQIPKMVADTPSTLVAVWPRYAGTRGDLVATRFDGASWSIPILIETDDTGSVLYPELCGNARGDVVAAWMLNSGTTYWYAVNRRSTATGWGTAISLSSPVSASTAMPCGVDATGHALLTVVHGANAFVRRAAVGTPISSEFPLESAAGPSESPAVVVLPDGRGFAVWSTSDGARYNLHVRPFE